MEIRGTFKTTVSFGATQFGFWGFGLDNALGMTMAARGHSLGGETAGA